MFGDFAEGFLGLWPWHLRSRLKEDVDELCKKAFAGGMAQAEQRANRMMRKDDEPWL